MMTREAQKKIFEDTLKKCDSLANRLANEMEENEDYNWQTYPESYFMKIDDMKIEYAYKRDTVKFELVQGWLYYNTKHLKTWIEELNQIEKEYREVLQGAC